MYTYSEKKYTETYWLQFEAESFFQDQKMKVNISDHKVLNLFDLRSLLVFNVKIGNGFMDYLYFRA